MTKRAGLVILSMLLAMLPGTISTPGAPQTKTATVSAGPVPAQIISAKSVFISNDGVDCNPSGAVGFSGGTDRAYDEFYAAMKRWGRYNLTAAPVDADLVFEIGSACPASGSNTVPGISGSPDSDPRFRLEIMDVKTHVRLWVLIEHVRPAVLQGNRDKNFDEAMAQLVADAKALTAESAAVTAGEWLTRCQGILPGVARCGGLRPYQN